MLLFQHITLPVNGLQNFKEYMHYELAPYPLTIFNQGVWRKTEKFKLYEIASKEQIVIGNSQCIYMTNDGMLLNRSVKQKLKFQAKKHFPSEV